MEDQEIVETKTRKRRTLEEREADAKAELEKIAQMRALKYRSNCSEVVSCIEAILSAQASGVQVPPDLISTCKSSLATFKKYAD